MVTVNKTSNRLRGFSLNVDLNIAIADDLSALKRRVRFSSLLSTKLVLERKFCIGWLSRQESSKDSITGRFGAVEAVKET
jgi:hypothetical protein